MIRFDDSVLVVLMPVIVDVVVVVVIIVLWQQQQQQQIYSVWCHSKEKSVMSILNETRQDKIKILFGKRPIGKNEKKTEGTPKRMNPKWIEFFVYLSLVCVWWLFAFAFFSIHHHHYLTDEDNDDDYNDDNMLFHFV